MQSVLFSYRLVLAILLFNIYTLDAKLPTAVAKKLAYADANRWLNVSIKCRTIPVCIEPTYLEVRLDRTLPLRRQLESLRRKLTLRVGLVR